MDSTTKQGNIEIAEIVQYTTHSEEIHMDCVFDRTRSLVAHITARPGTDTIGFEITGEIDYMEIITQDDCTFITFTVADDEYHVDKGLPDDGWLDDTEPSEIKWSAREQLDAENFVQETGHIMATHQSQIRR